MTISHKPASKASVKGGRAQQGARRKASTEVAVDGPRDQAEKADPRDEENRRLREELETQSADMRRLHEAEQQSRSELTARANQLDAVFEATADGMVIYDATGSLVHWNAAAAALFEFDRMPNYPGLPVATRPARLRVRDEHDQPIAPEDLPFMRALRGETLTGTLAVDLRITTPSGTNKHVNASAAPLRDETGQVIGAVVVYRDVTARRELERAAVTDRARWRAVVEHAPELVATCDAEGRLTYVNPAYERLLRRTLDDVPERPEERLSAIGLYLPDGSALYTLDMLPFQRAIREDRPVHGIEVLHRMAEGMERLVSWDAAPTRAPDGELLGAVAIGRDITEQRKQERRTIESLDALLAMAEALVRRDAGPEGRETEPAARVTARRIAELTRKVIGCQRVSITAIEPGTELLRPLAAVGLAPELESIWYGGAVLSLDESMAAYPDLLATLRAGEVAIIDMREPRFEGVENPFAIKQLVTAPMRVGERLVGLLALDYTDADHDYTRSEIELVAGVAKLGALVIERERLRHERERAEASALALREANRRMDEFLGVASHELRTPLTSVRANVQLAARRLRAALDQGETIDAAHLQPLDVLLARADRQTYLLDRLVSDLVDVSRIQNNKLEMRPEAMNLTDVVTEAVREQRLAWPNRPIPLEVPDEPVPVLADPDRIGQVVTNYLTNALKYSAADRPVPVSLRVEDGDERLARVAVRDEGPGLTPEQAERVWQRFERVPGIQVLAGSGVGLGLGLYISRTIVERHGGQVGVESAPGDGSTFWFTLPVEG